MGGTERYVADLARQLQERGVNAVVAAPGDRDASYMSHDLPVQRFGTAYRGDLRTLYGAGDPVAAQSFGHLLDREMPDLVHLHAFSPAVSLLTLREARRRSIPVLFTYHTPTVSCPRGTLMLWGKHPCDGVLDGSRCTSCVFQGHGVPRGLARALSLLPPFTDSVAGALGIAGQIGTGLRLRRLLELRIWTCRSFFSEVDHIFVLAEWTADVLRRNGVVPTKITIARHGVACDNESVGELPRRGGYHLPLRLCFIGRLDPAKGLHVVLRALADVPSLSLTLDAYLLGEGDSTDSYSAMVRALADGDHRVSIRRNVSRKTLLHELAAFDAVLVPSQGFETGPLVVLEAFEAGVPVIGSKLGGVADKVRDGIDGLLVEPTSKVAWKAVLRHVATHPGLLQKLRQEVVPPSPISDCVDEVVEIYNRYIIASRIAAC